MGPTGRLVAIAAGWEQSVGLIICLLSLGLCLTASCHTPSDATEILVIQGGTVFDSVGGTMLPNRTVVIENGRIADVIGPGGRLKIGRHFQMMDATGNYIVPGLIDAHVHLAHDNRLTLVTAEEVLPLFVAAGVTSVRDAGDNLVAEKMAAHYTERHPDLCPRIFLCSPLIDGDPPLHQWTGEAITDPAKVPEYLDEMVSWGVTTIKLYVRVSHDVFRKVIEEGHKRGLTVTAHLHDITAQEAVADGIDCLEHIWGASRYVWPDPDTQARRDLDNPKAHALISSLAEYKVMLSPTLTVFRNALFLCDLPEVYSNPDNAFVPERMRRSWEIYRAGTGFDESNRSGRMEEFEMYKELTGMLYCGGVTLLAGTDTGTQYTPPGFGLHQELELLVKSGLPPSAALQAATINNARALKQTENLGSVEVGRLADLVILNADPLDDIRNTRTIHKVIRGGIVCNPKTVLKAVPTH